MRLREPVRSARFLKRRLDQLVETFDASTITPDPLEVVLRYSDPRDQEVAGLFAAAFAYGRADIVVRNVSSVLDRMGASPYLFVREFSHQSAPLFDGFSHRFHKSADLVALIARVAAVVRHYGSVGSLFRACYDANDRHVGPSLARFVKAIIESLPPEDEKTVAALRYLLTSPVDGSACKRMNLYLRWMVRRSSPDLGLWTFVDPAKLIVPVDTHVHRIAMFLGLTERKSADWQTASSITERLARFDPHDPVKYDFAICRLGILDLCSRKRRKENCEVCLLRDVCRFPVE